MRSSQLIADIAGIIQQSEDVTCFAGLVAWKVEGTPQMLFLHGTSEKPELILYSDEDTLLRLQSGQGSFAELYRTGEIKATGNSRLLLQLSMLIYSAFTFQKNTRTN